MPNRDNRHNLVKELSRCSAKWEFWKDTHHDLITKRDARVVAEEHADHMLMEFATWLNLNDQSPAEYVTEFKEWRNRE